DYLQRHHPEARSKIVISRLGAYGPSEKPDVERRQSRTVVSCSAVSDVKRVDRIHEAIRLLPHLDATRPVRWVHFGDGPLMPQLRALCANPPTGVAIELRGQVPNEEIREFYATGAADLFVNLSSSEGVPV